MKDLLNKNQQSENLTDLHVNKIYCAHTVEGHIPGEAIKQHNA